MRGSRHTRTLVVVVLLALGGALVPALSRATGPTTSPATTAHQQPYSPQAKRGTADVGADKLWDQGITGKGVTVGVADSGIDGRHPDLNDQDWRTWGAGSHPAKLAASDFVNCLAVLPA